MRKLSILVLLIFPFFCNAQQTTLKTEIFEVQEGKTNSKLKIFPYTSERVGLEATLEQSCDGGTTWYILGGFNTFDVNNSRKNLEYFEISFNEQIVRSDVATKYNWKTRRIVESDTHEEYFQLELCNLQRLTTYSYSLDNQNTRINYPLEFVVEKEEKDVLPPVLLLGHHSASLLGTFTGATGNGVASVTTSSRTTTNGSLIVSTGNSYRGTTVVTSHATTDSKSNSYTDIEATSGTVRTSTAYNLGGTRGTTHTITLTPTGGAGGGPNLSLGGAEFDGIATSPTIVSNSSTGASTAPSITQAVSNSSLVIGHVTYLGTATTITANVGTEAYEIDEASVAQAQNVLYSVAQVGTPSLSWTLGSSKTWLTTLYAFSEATTSSATSTTSTEASATTTAQLATLGFGLAIIITIMLIAVIAYLYNSFTVKKAWQ